MNAERKQLYRELYENGLVAYEECPKEESGKYNDLYEDELPDNIERKTSDGNTKYYQYSQGNLKNDEIILRLLLKLNSNMKFVKIFLILNLICILLSVILLLKYL